MKRGSKKPVAKRSRKSAAKPPRKGAGGKPAKPVLKSGSKSAAKPRRSFFGRLFYWAAVTGVWAGIAAIGVVAYYALDLPDVDRLGEDSARARTTLLAADGSEMAVFGERRGVWTDVRDAPVALVQAVLATEDRRFYSHFGIDILGLGRATLANIKARRIVQGGSTISQQLAKNLFLTPERTLKRKIQELMLAVWLEHIFSKDQILTLYLNRVYLGAGTYGIDGASRRYFAKPVTELNAWQSAVLAGLLKAPSRYSPTNSQANAEARAGQVVDNMVDAGFLTVDEAREVRRLPLAVKATPALGGARYFADWVMPRFSGYIGTGDGDLVIQTTLDPRLQSLAEKAVSNILDRDGETMRAGQAALVALSTDGAVRAMVGGRSYTASQFNRATQARRQPGSAFKLFVYLAAMETGLTPDSVMRDTPIILDGWQPRNYSGQFLGSVTLREAMARSINTVAVKLSERVDRRQVIAAAQRLGITTTITGHPSVALGTSEVRLIELTGAYAAVANGGFLVAPHGVTEVRAGTGRLLFERPSEDRPRVMLDLQVSQLAGMLQEVIATGTGQAARLDRPAAGKTGTSQDFRDAVFVGYTADLVAGVWVGNDDGAPMRRVAGGGLPARIWRDFMAPATKDSPVRELLPVDKDKKRGLWDRLFSRK